MKKLLLILIMLGLLAASAYVYTQSVNNNNPWSNSVAWKSDPSNPVPGANIVSIQSGGGVNTQVQITVDHNSAGAKISNCGGTTHLTPGSSAMCLTSDPNHALQITSDDLNKPAFGTYQMRTEGQ